MRKPVFLVAATLVLASASPTQAQVVVINGGSAPPGFISITTPPSFGGFAVTNGGIHTFPAYPGFGAYPAYPPVYTGGWYPRLAAVRNATAAGCPRRLFDQS